MRILTVSNLYPRPDQPTRGMFNAQLFRAMAHAMRETEDNHPHSHARGPEGTEGEASGEVTGISSAAARGNSGHASLHGDKCQRAGDGEQKTDIPHHAVGETSPTSCPRRDESHLAHHAVGVTSPTSHNSLTNICLVPEWRVWRWGEISGWSEPGDSNCFTHYLPAAYVPMVGRDRSWRTYEWSLRAAAHLFDECDVVYSSWLYPDGVAAVNFAASRGKPAWLMVLGSDTFHLDYPHRKKAILKACEKAQGVVCGCNLLKERLVAAGVEAEKVHVVPNGVDTSKFYYRPKEAARRELTKRDPGLEKVFGRDRKVVLFVGNLVPVKGPDVFLKALAKMDESYPLMVNRGERIDHGSHRCHGLGEEEKGEGLWSGIIVGDGAMRGKLETMAQDLDIADRVNFAGSRPHDELPFWMNACDCLCLSSRSEGMPNVVLEALACGMPVVATDVGACGEMIDNAGHCSVIPAEEPGALAGALAFELGRSCDRVVLSQRRETRCWADQAADILELVGF
jgi:teichuronic acid biosynthesis glycosyltransferase TuaC